MAGVLEQVMDCQVKKKAIIGIKVCFEKYGLQWFYVLFINDILLQVIISLLNPGLKIIIPGIIQVVLVKLFKWNVPLRRKTNSIVSQILVKMEDALVSSMTSIVYVM